MNKIFTLAIALFATAFSAVGQNLVTNGGFETWTTTTAFPDSWVPSSAAHWGLYYFYVTDTNQGNVLRLADLTSSTVAARRFNTTVDFSILTEGAYRVTFKVKGNVGLRAVVLVKGTATPSTTTQSATNHATSITDYPSGTTVADWTTLQYTINVPSTATFGTDYRLHISWSSSLTAKPVCDFQIDDISLEKVTGPTTSIDNQTVTTPAIFGLNGKINFNTLENVSYTVVNLNGSKVAEGIAAAGSSIDLPKGAYIVKTQQKAYKVVL